MKSEYCKHFPGQPGKKRKTKGLEVDESLEEEEGVGGR